MNRTVFRIVAILALVWNLFALVDLYMTLTRNADYLAGQSPEMLAMIEAFPEWRQLLWTVSVFLGVIGAVLLLVRRAMAERVFWATAVAMAIGFLGYDLPFGGGIEGYGTFGVAFSFLLIGIECVFALYARRAARHGLLR